jgi:hypothetical protein
LPPPAPRRALPPGSVIVAAAAGARWRLWPDGHPVVCLASGRDLDVAAMAGDRVRKGRALLFGAHAGAAAATHGRKASGSNFRSRMPPHAVPAQAIGTVAHYQVNPAAITTYRASAAILPATKLSPFQAILTSA